MKKKTALITGISGQDGSYLANFLLKKNYNVVGSDRRSARSNLWRLKHLNIQDKIKFEELELTESSELERLIKKYKFDEIYNLAAQSFVATSFSSPMNTCNVSGFAVLRFLEVIRNSKQKIKLYQASSSEMFGDVLEKKQNENTPFNPQSPYAVAKTFGHYLINNYRSSYKMFCVSGILFNHESPLRGQEFVTKKITTGIAKLVNGDIKCLELGNIYAKRDWGYAKEYVELMWKMLQKKKPEDFVISTGESHSIKEFVNVAMGAAGIKTKWVGKGLNERLIDIKNKRIIVKINKKFFRPAEVNYLRGDSSKAKRLLKWKPKTTFNELVKKMVEFDLENYSIFN